MGNSWQGVSSWFPRYKPQQLTQIFPVFLRWWETWEESAKVALKWYLQANTNSLVQEQIVLIQVALELIAWVLLVEEKHTVSEGGFDKLPASDKIRLLLSQFGITLEIPPLNHLIQLAQDSNWVDGPHALTEIRNEIIYPKKKKREKVYQASFEVKHEVANLGLWYLELVLLAMFNYQGNYENWLLINAPPQPVPWS